MPLLGGNSLSGLLRGGAALDPTSYDSSAAAWFAAVEATGANFGPTPESAISNKAAFNAWFMGCKSDNIFGAIGTGCFHVAISSLDATMVPFVGADTVTNNGILASEYNRLTGLTSTGSDLVSSRKNNTDSQNSQHFAIWNHEICSLSSYFMLQAASTTESVVGCSNLRFAAGNKIRRSRSDTSNSATGNYNLGLSGISRSRSSAYDFITGSSLFSLTKTSQTPDSALWRVFGTGGYTDGRIKFWSVGSGLNLSLLNDRLTTLFANLV